MANATFFPAFEYKWAQDGSIYNWEDTQYKTGWATIGAVPPSVEQFNRAQQIVDEKANWLYRQIADAAADRGVVLSALDNEGLKKVLRNFTPAASTATAGIAKISTAGLVNAGADNSTIVTPALLAGVLGTGRVYGVNDYVRIPNAPGGLMIQWGRWTYPDIAGGPSNGVGAPDATLTIHFNVAFTRQMFTFVATTESTQNLGTPIRTMRHGGQLSLTKVDLVLNELTPVPAAHHINWICIGQ